MPLNHFRNLKMVRKERLEHSRVAPLAPKASASTNSATFAPDKTRWLRYPEFILNSGRVWLVGRVGIEPTTR